MWYDCGVYDVGGELQEIGVVEFVCLFGCIIEYGVVVGLGCVQLYIKYCYYGCYYYYYVGYQLCVIVMLQLGKWKQQEC